MAEPRVLPGEPGRIRVKSRPCLFQPHFRNPHALSTLFAQSRSPAHMRVGRHDLLHVRRRTNALSGHGEAAGFGHVSRRHRRRQLPLARGRLESGCQALGCEQNALTRRYLDALPQRPAIARRVATLLRSAPYQHYDFRYRKRLFALKVQPPKNQPMLVAASVHGRAVGDARDSRPERARHRGPHRHRFLHAFLRRPLRHRFAVDERQRGRNGVRLRHRDRQAALPTSSRA